jgi:hypothetical protein
MHAKFWSEKLNRRDHLEDLGIDGRILKSILKKWDVRVWTRFIQLRIAAGGGLL